MATKFKWNNAGFEEIRRSPEAVAILEANVEAAAADAGDGYRGSIVQGVGRGSLGRAIGTVWTETFRAIHDNAKHKTLLRVFDRLGG